MRFVVKAYQEVYADLIMMLEDLEESLEDISRAANLPENPKKLPPVDDKYLCQVLDTDLSR